MELADKVGEKRLSGFPEKFDPKFGESSYLATEGGKSRVRGYLWTFGYMVFCGVLLVIGGGTFFIYESTVINRPPEYDASKGVQRSAKLQDAFFVQEKAQYSKELQTVAFVFIGVGAVLFVVGAPLATQFYRRYRRAKEVERSPILDPLNQEKKQKVKIYKEFATKKSKPSQRKVEGVDSTSLQGSKGDQSPIIWPESPTPQGSIRNKRRKSRTAWTYRSPKKISEGFRFAAHRHPSMNPIKLEGISFPDRHFSLESSPTTSDDDSDSSLTDAERSGPSGFRGFMNKLFGIAENAEKTNDVAPTSDSTHKTTADESYVEMNDQNTEIVSTLDDVRRMSRNKGTVIIGKRSGYEELENSDNEAENETGTSTGGLYNLG